MPMTTDKNPHIGLDPVTVDWSKFDKHPSLNPADIPVGSVVYYVRKIGNQYRVDYGLVYQHYKDCVAIQRVMPRDRRMVKSAFTKNPVPFKDFPHQTEWRKLPKGWTWNTELFSYAYEEMTEEEKTLPFDIRVPETIVYAYNKGYLVNVRDVPYEKIEAVIDKVNGYKLIRKAMDDHHAFVENRPVDLVGISPFQCFSSHKDAQAACIKAEEELRAQAEMTDLEWSIHQIEQDIARWAKLYSVSEENAARVRDFLMQLDDLENVETRVCTGGIQYKKWNNARWMNVPIE